MKIQVMHVSQENTHRLLRTALNRVAEFTGMYESDADPEIICAELASAYFQQNPTTMMWVGMDAGEIVGHLIATIDHYYGGKFVTIHQCWKDPEIKDFSLDEKKGLTEVVKDFGRRHDCKLVRTFAINQQVAGILESYGFKRSERVILEIPTEPTPSSTEN